MAEHTHHSCVRIVPIFNHLEDETMDLISTKINRRSLKKGEFLYQAGDRGDVLYVVHSGLIRISRIAQTGKEQLVRFMEPGDFIGAKSLFEPDAVHDDYAEAMKDTEVCQLKGEDLQKLLSQYPQISIEIMSELTKRLDQSERQTTYVSTEQVGTRLALYLVDQVSPEEPDHDVTIQLTMSRKDLASYLGTTPETISRKFKQLEEEDYIIQKSGKEIFIPDVDELLFYSD